MIVREITAKNIVTKSDLPVCDYSLNPYVGCEHACRYCYACFMKRFTGHTEEWGEFLDVKYWEPISRPEKYAGKEIFIGSVTDPYQPAEKAFRRTRAALEQLAGSGAKLSIATKSDLVLRDLELIKSFQDARVSWSVNTLDEAFRADMDNAAPIERRLAAMKAGSAARYGHDISNKADKITAEGIEALKEVSSSLDDALRMYVGGIQSGMGYLGAPNLEALRKNARYIRVSGAGQRESNPHDVIEVKNPVK